MRALLARDPFGDRPPRYVRAELYEYHFAPRPDPSGASWRRTRVGEYLRPFALNDPELHEILPMRLARPDDGHARP